MSKHEEITDDEVLAPDDEIEIEGARITVRAFRFVEGLKATQIARPILEALREIVEKEPDQLLSVDAILGMMADQADTWTELVAMATDQSPEWVRGLSEADGMALFFTFWRVNRGFFTTRLRLALVPPEVLLSAPSRSSASSSQPDMEGTPKSSPGVTPGGSSEGSTSSPSAPETTDAPT